MEALDNLVKINKLQKEPPNQAEFDGMLAAANTKLQDVQLQGLSRDGMFTLAYGAAHALALAALRWHSYRSDHEVYHDFSPANERPRYEPRTRWPGSAQCAFPHAPVAGKPGAPIRLDVRYHENRKHLPIFDLRLAA